MGGGGSSRIARVLAVLGWSGFNHITDGALQQMQGNLQIALTNQTFSGPEGRSLGRRLSGHILQEYFMSYGCWCTFEDQKYNHKKKTRGQPMDEWDQNCKELKMGYECAMVDAASRGESCVPWTTEYPIAGAGMSERIISRYCEIVSDGDLCKEATCIVETYFINRLAEFIIPGQPPGFLNLDYVDPRLLHENGFSPGDECIRMPGTEKKSKEKDCCGDYPRRYPFKTMNKQCCESGVIRDIAAVC